MTIDLEEYFHANAMEEFFPRNRWQQYPSRIKPGVENILRLLDQEGTKATFFCLGIVAKNHPSLVRSIAEQGHEVANHGWDHTQIHRQDKASFCEDAGAAKKLLEDITGIPVVGYRAASFSMDERSPWAREVLAGAGHIYSSSVNPVIHDVYGNPDSKTEPYLDRNSGLWEIPVTALTIFGKRLPCGGGGFFRLLPNIWFRAGIRQAESRKIPANFYLHPWELDPAQPRPTGLSWKTGFRHYYGLRHCADKFARHLQIRKWGRMDKTYASWINASQN